LDVQLLDLAPYEECVDEIAHARHYAHQTRIKWELECNAEIENKLKTN